MGNIDNIDMAIQISACATRLTLLYWVAVTWGKVVSFSLTPNPSVVVIVLQTENVSTNNT